MAWNGWGDAARKPTLPAGGLDYLASRIGALDGAYPSVAVESLAPRATSLSTAVSAALCGIVGVENVLQDDYSRALRSGGKSYPDVIRRRLGDVASAPDAVVLPGNEQEVADLIALGERERIAIVPFGGGTSVVGGVEPERGSFTSLITLDLRRMTGLVSHDHQNLTATFLPGTRGSQAEAMLNAHGLTLGHFPQSYHYASIGGYAATRSAGQSSAGYGRSDEMIVGLRMVTPRGLWTLGTGTRNAAGPSMLDLAIGSEGQLGIITEVTLRVHPLPKASEYEGWFADSFEQGIEALRDLEQHGCAPTVTRLSDVNETETSLLLAGLPDTVRSVLMRYLGLRKVTTPCLAIVGWVGDPDTIAGKRRTARRILKAHGLVSGGKRFGKGWEHGRFDGPYMRDTLIDHGMFLDTLETATTWTAMPALHVGVGDALRESLAAWGTPAHVNCHVSHVYPSGGSLYFTIVAKVDRERPLEQWKAAKTAANDAIVAHGATITHHHAIGTDHRHHLQPEIGEIGVRALRAVKAELDPHGILNPGKLLPDS